MAIIIDKGALCICVRKSSNVILLTKEMKKSQKLRCGKLLTVDPLECFFLRPNSILTYCHIT